MLQGNIFGGAVLVGFVQWQAYSPYFGDALARMQVRAGNLRKQDGLATGAAAPLLSQRIQSSDSAAATDNTASHPSSPLTAESPHTLRHRHPSGVQLYAVNEQGLAILPVSAV
jgi:hypothetical protein